MDPNNNNLTDTNNPVINPQPVGPIQTPTITNNLIANPPIQPILNQVQPQVAPIQTNNVSRIKLIAYFLIGLLTNIFGLIIAGLWILVKVKENKKPRFLSLLAGLGTAIILALIFSLVISPLLQPAMVNRYPELAYITTALAVDFPDAKFNVGINSTKNLTGQSTGEVISTLKISIITSQPLTGSVRKQIGEKVCDLLEQHGSSYTNIEVSQTKINKVLIFSYDQSFTEGRTCQEWHQNPANNFGPTN